MITTRRVSEGFGGILRPSLTRRVEINSPSRFGVLWSIHPQAANLIERQAASLLANIHSSGLLREIAIDEGWNIDTIDEARKRFASLWML